MSNTAITKQGSENNVVNIPERTEQQQYYTPLVDIIETADAFIFQADLPGVKTGDVDVSFENGTLTIAGKVAPRRPENGGRYVWREYGVGHFYRTFTLSTPVNVDGIQAQLTNGELTLTVPKADSVKSRKIEIKSA